MELVFNSFTFAEVLLPDRYKFGLIWLEGNLVPISNDKTTICASAEFHDWDMISTYHRKEISQM